MATRQEALRIAESLTPTGFKFNALELREGVWITSYIDDSIPPRVVIERWDDFYTENDPKPVEGENEDITETQESEDDNSNSNVPVR